MKIVAISDTHNKHGQIHPHMPEADILIHSGDFCGYGDLAELQIFSMWLDLLPYKYKIIVAGNHDKSLQNNRVQAEAILKQAKGVIYLRDNHCTISGVKFYGTPWLPPIGDWAWGLNDAGRKQVYSKIPKDTDVLITHTPPMGCGDSSARYGCKHLRARVDEVKPKFHVFGHVHEGAGIGNNGYTTFINAATLNRQYKVNNKPVVFEISK